MDYPRLLQEKHIKSAQGQGCWVKDSRCPVGVLKQNVHISIHPSLLTIHSIFHRGAVPEPRQLNQ
jgi:hypothetical protein